MMILNLTFNPNDRQISLPATLWVYADEQGSSTPSAQQKEFAVGLLFASNEIDGNFVRQYRLKRENCTCKLQLPYFHASPDCWPCRNRSADMIVNYPEDLFFISLRWEHDKSSPGHPTDGTLHVHAIALALNFLRLKGVENINLEFAQISNLSVSKFSHLLQEEESFLKIANDTYERTYHPLTINPQQVSADDAGVQIVDRVLWQENRRDTKYDLSSLKLVQHNSMLDQEGPISIRRYGKPNVMIR